MCICAPLWQHCIIDNPRSPWPVSAPPCQSNMCPPVCFLRQKTYYAARPASSNEQQCQCAGCDLSGRPASLWVALCAFPGIHLRATDSCLRPRQTAFAHRILRMLGVQNLLGDVVFSQTCSGYHDQCKNAYLCLLSLPQIHSPTQRSTVAAWRCSSGHRNRFDLGSVCPGNTAASLPWKTAGKESRPYKGRHKGRNAALSRLSS